jgi:4-diphosphocytidyl-2-C-methyl-D-erythritol kinase
MICFPNAKINLGLNVVEKRPDGYHNLETIFLPIGIKDALEIVPSGSSDADYQWANSGRIIDGNPSDNICIKALMKLKQHYPQIPSLNIHLHKNIPFGAGLGGGSADGAFMLTMLNNYFELGVSNAELKEIAASLGADCAFFIDNKPAFATGIGNILSPVEITLKGYHLAVIIPNVHVSTPEAYRGVKPAYPAIRLNDAIQQPIETWKETVFNDFETSVFAQYPVIEQVKNHMYAQGAVYASMSGSGSSVFGIFKDKPELAYPDYFQHVEQL